MTKSIIVEKGWYKKPRPPKVPKAQPKPKKRIDAKFEEWAKKNNIDLKTIPVMEKKK